MPEGLSLPTEPVRLLEDGTLFFVWIDGADEAQEPVDFSLRITAMDLAGNMGPTSEPLRVQDSGSEAGCQVAPGQTNGMALVWGVLALLVFARRI